MTTDTLPWWAYLAIAAWALYAASGGSLYIWRKQKRRMRK